jgi:hypothetical protein
MTWRFRLNRIPLSQLEIRSLTQSLCAPDVIKEEQRNQQDMCNTSNKTSKSYETYSRTTPSIVSWLNDAMMPTRRKRRSQSKPLCVLAVPQPANKAYSLMREEPQAAFKASVKPGRFPNTFELLEIEKA